MNKEQKVLALCSAPSWRQKGQRRYCSARRRLVRILRSCADGPQKFEDVGGNLMRFQSQNSFANPMKATDATIVQSVIGMWTERSLQHVEILPQVFQEVSFNNWIIRRNLWQVLRTVHPFKQLSRPTSKGSFPNR